MLPRLIEIELRRHIVNLSVVTAQEPNPRQGELLVKQEEFLYSDGDNLDPFSPNIIYKNVLCEIPSTKTSCKERDLGKFRPLEEPI